MVNRNKWKVLKKNLGDKKEKKNGKDDEMIGLDCEEMGEEEIDEKVLK